jgi:hypothetical protein
VQQITDYELTKNETEKCSHCQEKNHFLQHPSDPDLPNVASPTATKILSDFSWARKKL